MDKKNRAFITGWPVEHSRSPLVHSYWLKKYGLAGDYQKHPCEENAFEEFLTTLASSPYIGGNVTIPHKERAFQYAEVLHPKAKALGAVNTLWLEDGKLHGDNTDGYGFLANLDERAAGWDNRSNQKRGALVLGAGGAARAIILALIDRGFSPIFIANRTLERAKELASKFGNTCQPIDIAALPAATHSCSVIINTTSLGMDGKSSPLDLSVFSKGTVVNDIVYTPLRTPLLMQADKIDMVPVDGLGMLLHQAVPGFEKWFGVRPEVTEELRSLLLEDLGEKQ